MNTPLLKKAILCAFCTAVYLAPLGANAQNTSGVTDWLSHMFNWQTSLTNRLSGMFEARKDTVESNSIARNQLLDWQRGVAPIGDSSTTALLSSTTVSTNSIGSNDNASSSPLFIPSTLFENKKAAIAVELLTAENSLKANEAQLADIISNRAANGDDTSAVQSELDQTNADISLADQSISAFKNYEPMIASSSNKVDLQIPQSYLTAAIKAIQTAKASLKSVIGMAVSSAQ